LATPLTAVLSAAASLGVTAPSAIASTIAEAAATRSDAATIIIANKQIAAAREETKKVIAATRAQTEATFKQTEATIRLEELRKTSEALAFRAMLEAAMCFGPARGVRRRPLRARAN
jgi:hypothetical protein